MNKNEFQAKSIQMILDAAGTIQGGKIQVLNRTFTVAKVGKHYMTLTGERGATYTLSTSPRCVVKESKECNVYFLTTSTGAKVCDFTYFDGQTTEVNESVS